MSPVGPAPTIRTSVSIEEAAMAPLGGNVGRKRRESAFPKLRHSLSDRHYCNNCEPQRHRGTEKGYCCWWRARPSSDARRTAHNKSTFLRASVPLWSQLWLQLF